MKHKILFVTWDGPQVAYLESLFLPIFAGLQPHGLHFDVLQFCWGDEDQAAGVAARCESAGCGYRAVPVRRGLGGLGPFLTALGGGREVRAAADAFGSEVVMPRSLMPAIAVLSAGGARFRPMLFDADGLAADERVDFAGLSSRGPTYRMLRIAETRAVRDAASVIVRSRRAAEILSERAAVEIGRFHVVANGRDAALFAPSDAVARAAVRAELGVAAPAPLAVYAGSVGPQYRFDRISAFMAALARLRPDARLLVLSGSPDDARAALGKDCAGAPIVMRAAPEAVPRYLAAADVGLAYRSPSFSMQGVAPVKLAEYLLCGVPTVGAAAVGDTSAAAEAGVFLADEAGPEAEARWVAETVLGDRDAYRDRARRVGLETFSLARSVSDYLAALAPLR